jgi:membrane dipeptidase
MAQLQLTKAQEDRAAALQQESLIIDAMAGYIVAPEPPPVDGKTYLERLLTTNIRVVNITIAAHSDSFDKALEEMFHYFNLLQVAPDRTIHIKRVADIERARKEKKVGILFGFQSPTPIENQFLRWTIFQQLGVRTCQLAYMERSILADGCFEPANNGLTYYGIQAVQEMNRLGIVVDLSHVGERSSMEALELSEKPCIFSHSNAKAVTPGKRNVPDEAIKLLAKKGGVIGLTPHAFMTYKEVGKRPTLSDYLDHFEYIAKLVGTDHIGIGSDVFESYTKFSWETSTKLLYKSPWMFETMLAEGFSKVTEISNVVKGLVARGFSDADIKKIMGDNFLRVFKAVWRDDF